MRVAICGVGQRSSKVLGYLKDAMPEVSYVGYYDPQPEVLATTFPGENIKEYPSVAAMLSDSRPDLLFVGSPNHVHLEQIELGLKAGVRVFTEKPVVSSFEQTWQLIKLLKQYGSDRVMVGLVLRYAPQMIDLTDAIKKGQIGDVISLEANEHIEPSHGGFFMCDWRRYDSLTGGYMLEKCVHDIDIYNVIVGARANKVASFGGKRLFTEENKPTDPVELEFVDNRSSIWKATQDPFKSDADIVDHQTAIVSYENGASLAFHTNIFVPDEQRRFVVVGTKGMAEGDFQRGSLSVTASPSGTRVFERDYSKTAEAFKHHYGADAQMGKELAKHLRGETENLPVNVFDALEAGITALAIDEARRSGSVINLDPYWQRFDEIRFGNFG